MGTMAYQIASLTIVYSTVYSGADQRNIKAPRHWLLWGEFTGDFPAQRAGDVENVSIWLRHHVLWLDRTVPEPYARPTYSIRQEFHYT